MYFRGITQDTRRKLRGEVLEMTPERLCEAAEEFYKKMYFCVVSSKDTIDEVIKTHSDRKFNCESINR